MKFDDSDWKISIIIALLLIAALNKFLLRNIIPDFILIALVALFLIVLLVSYKKK
jgi:hypothetical protein